MVMVSPHSGRDVHDVLNFCGLHWCGRLQPACDRRCTDLGLHQHQHDFYRYVGTGENVVDALEVEADDVISSSLRRVLERSQHGHRSLALQHLAINSNWHDRWVVVWHVTWCSSGVLGRGGFDRSQIHLVNLVDTVIVQ